MTLTAADPPAECDVAVVGGGIVGTATARELARRRPGARICLLEAEAGLAAHQSGRSSGVIHAGLYYEPGSLKARLCVDGARRLYAYCEERGLPCRRSGKLVVAVSEAELERLDELERRGRENGVAELRRLGPDEIPAVEPAARGVAALHSPHTGVADFAAVTRSLAADFVALGGTIHLGADVASLAENTRGLKLRHARGTTTAGGAVICAGLRSDRLAVACGAPADPRIVPFRGAYLQLPPAAAELVRANVYPVPDPALPFLGAHLTRSIEDRVLVGPSALIAPGRHAYRLRDASLRDVQSTLLWPGTWRLAARHRRSALREIRHALDKASFLAEAARLVPALDGIRAKPGPVGIRAQALGRDGALIDDFVLHRTEHAVHVRNAPSPAATSALALAPLIADKLDATNPG